MNHHDIKKLYIFLLAFAIIHTTSAQDWLWQNPQPQGNDLNCVRFVDAYTGYAVGDSGTVLKTTNGGSSWNPRNTGTIFHYQAVHFPTADTGYIAGTGIIPGTQDFCAVILKTMNGAWTGP